MLTTQELTFETFTCGTFLSPEVKDTLARLSLVLALSFRGIYGQEMIYFVSFINKNGATAIRPPAASSFSLLTRPIILPRMCFFSFAIPESLRKSTNPRNVSGV